MSEAVRTMMRMDAEAAQEAAAQADAGFLWDFWYPAARSTEIRGQKLVTAMLLEVPLVLGRTSEGKVFAMRDSCPHRGIPLSYGRLDGKVVECCYHGRSEEHTSELQSRFDLVCRLLLEKKKSTQSLA